jgi:hypothetical protein
MWLVSTEPALADPKAVEDRTLIEITGHVTGLDKGDFQPPSGWRMVFSAIAGPATQALTIHDDSGVDWNLGYQLARTEPTMEIAPDPHVAVGSAVTLRFRAIHAFGRAASFVLTDAKGIALAVDLAFYGDPFQQNDVPGLGVRAGARLGIAKNLCGDLAYSKLIFDADTSVEVGQNESRAVTIKQVPYTAFNLFNFVPAAGPDAPRCPDAIGEARGWAVWRAR